MGIFKDFEKKLESLFEGVFLRAFKSGVHPVELGKKLVREMEGHKTIGVSSRVYVPNRYDVGLSERDYSRFESYQAVMATELENLLVSYAKDRGYAVLDRPQVRLTEEDSLREGEFWIRCRTEGEIPSAGEKEKARAAGRRPQPAGQAGLELMGSGGVAPFFAIEGDATLIGRVNENDIVLPDPNVSRSHARVTRRGERYIITDLDSTNGTWLNEQRVSEAELGDDDVIRLGGTRLLFRRSRG